MSPLENLNTSLFLLQSCVSLVHSATSEKVPSDEKILAMTSCIIEAIGEVLKSLKEFDKSQGRPIAVEKSEALVKIYNDLIESFNSLTPSSDEARSSVASIVEKMQRIKNAEPSDPTQICARDLLPFCH